MNSIIKAIKKLGTKGGRFVKISEFSPSHLNEDAVSKLLYFGIEDNLDKGDLILCQEAARQQNIGFLKPSDFIKKAGLINFFSPAV